MAEIEAQIKQFILDSFVFSGSPDDIDTNASFMATGMIDSLGILELIAFVEGAFGIEVDDHEVIPENFDSVRGLSNYVTAKLLSPTMQAA